MSDVLDILDVDRSETPEISKETILGNDAKKKRKKFVETTFKRPEGMRRELYALLYSDNKDGPPLFSTASGQGYKQNKAKLGLKRARSWKWMPFTNSARKDAAVFHHWRRVADEGEDYPFAKFNKSIPIPTYTDTEYAQHLHSEVWTRQETDHLFDLCRRFDLRFIVLQDRFPSRSIEDLKERYYNICNTLAKVRMVGVQYAYDGDHERKRKEQLIKLYDRPPKWVEEEQSLLTELRKIELRKKEREKKTQDLQKLIGSQRLEKKGPKKSASVETAGIKFADLKGNSVTLRSHRMKLPASMGQKKTKAIEQLLKELDIEPNPIPSDEICTHFNELRSDMVLLYELKLASANYEFELQALRHQTEMKPPGKIKTNVLESALVATTVAV